MEMFLAPLPMVNIYSQLNRFGGVCSNADDFNNRNLFLTAKILKFGYRYHKIRKTFSKFYHRHSELIVKYRVFLYKGLRNFTICSKTVVGQCALTIPSIIAGSWFASGK